MPEENRQYAGQVQQRLVELEQERDGIQEEIQRFMDAQKEQKELQAKKE